jgi:hypothetical protein
MDTNAFWDVIEKSRKGADDCEAQAEQLAALLGKLPPPEIVDFQKHFTKLIDEAYRWDLWAVAYIVHGGCSDDSFEYFRCWLIGQGRKYYEAALLDPERAVDNVEPGDYAECEDLLYVASQTYQEVTGDEEMPAYARSRPSEPVGTSWDEDKVQELYPKLAKRFEYGAV